MITRTENRWTVTLGEEVAGEYFTQLDAEIVEAVLQQRPDLLDAFQYEVPWSYAKGAYESHGKWRVPHAGTYETYTLAHLVYRFIKAGHKIDKEATRLDTEVDRYIYVLDTVKRQGFLIHYNNR